MKSAVQFSNKITIPKLDIFCFCLLVWNLNGKCKMAALGALTLLKLVWKSNGRIVHSITAPFKLWNLTCLVIKCFQYSNVWNSDPSLHIAYWDNFFFRLKTLITLLIFLLFVLTGAGFKATSQPVVLPQVT